MWASAEYHSYGEKIGQYLKTLGIDYQFSSEEELKVPLKSLVRGVFFKSEKGPLMAVVLSEEILDVGLLEKRVNRAIEVMTLEERDRFFSQNGTLAEENLPLPDLLKVSGIVDEAVFQADRLYFKISNENKIIKVEKPALSLLFHHVQVAKFAFPLETLEKKRPQSSFIEKLKKTKELPAIPLIAQKILKLRGNSKASVADLVQIVQLDPSLTAQLMSWAQSAYYGYAGKITSLDYAIVKVLGFDLVLNLAIVISLGHHANIPKEGPLGLREYWRFAIYTGALVEALVEIMPKE